MVAYADVVAARPVAVQEAGWAWEGLAATLAIAAETMVVEAARPLEWSWDGDAANAAFTLVGTLDDEMELAALRARGLAAVFASAAERIGEVQRRIAAAVDAAADAGLTVTNDGRVRLPWLEDWQRHDPDGIAARADLAAYARDVQGRLDGLVEDATALDEEFTQLLAGHEIRPEDRGGNRAGEWAAAAAAATAAARFGGLSEDAIPAPNGDPVGNAAWWGSLTPAQRQAYADAWPQRVGSLDGLPAVCRDAANRRWLRRHLDDLRAEPPADPADPHERLDPAGPTDQNWIDDAQRLLDRLESQDADPERRTQPLFLLAIDTAGDGRAVVSIGDPDLATHVAVSVPGTTQTLGGIKGQINRWNNVQADSADLLGASPNDVATVVWFDYDAPDGYAQAAAPHYAEDAAAGLTRFVDGIRASHPGPTPHVTVLGHSYGSVVVGEAARLHDGTGDLRRDVLHADDIVVTGSPGMGVTNADQLNVPDGHLWVGMADADWMRAGGDTVHNTDPHDPAFAGERVRPFRFHVDPAWDAFPFDAHSSYWDGAEDGRGAGATNQARIIIGHTDGVTGEEARLPPRGPLAPDAWDTDGLVPHAAPGATPTPPPASSGLA